MWPLLALLAAAALAGQALTRPALGTGFLYDRPSPPRVLREFYPNERAPDGLTFAWTHPTAEVRFDGLDREVPWAFRVAFTGTSARSAETLDRSAQRASSSPSTAWPRRRSNLERKVPISPSPFRRGASRA